MEDQEVNGQMDLQGGVGQKSDLKADQGQPKCLIKYKGKGRFYL